ncbi:hypothetical protein K1719_037081 [Acacia pycnantha]|nr:hypothetical protein K1719_037081 [Acacia pycnantha]
MYRPPLQLINTTKLYRGVRQRHWENGWLRFVFLEIGLLFLNKDKPSSSTAPDLSPSSPSTPHQGSTLKQTDSAPEGFIAEEKHPQPPLPEERTDNDSGIGSSDLTMKDEVQVSSNTGIEEETSRALQ